MQPETATDRTLEVSPIAAPGPELVAYHQLYRRIPTLKHALALRLVHRWQDKRMSDPFDPNNIPPKQLEVIVRDGELYALWDQRTTTPAHLDSRWAPEGARLARMLHGCRLSFKRRSPRTNPEED
jgi:hypothetical protein